MAAPKVTIREIDLSTRVPSFPGVYGAICIPMAAKGPVGTAYLVTSESQLLKVFTPDERVEMGYSQAYYSAIAFLQKSNKLWVIRVANTPYYGGASVAKEDTYEYIAPASVTVAADTLTLENHGYADDTVVQFVNVGGALPSPLAVETDYYVIDTDDDTFQVAASAGGSAITLTDQGTGAHYVFAVSYANARWASGSEIEDPDDDFDFTAVESFIVYGANPGEWNDNIGIKIYKYYAAETFTADATTNLLTVSQHWTTGTAVFLSNSGGTIGLPTYVADGATGTPLAASTMYYTIWDAPGRIKLATSLANALVGTAVDIDNAGDGTNTIKPAYEKCKVEGAFTIEVVKMTDASTVLETHTCSLTQGDKDGYNRNIFIEDALESSDYIRATVNALSSDTYPKEQTQTPLQLQGGSDGGVVTDGQLVLATAKFENPEDLPITLFMDGGWSTAVYQLQLISLASSRKDSVALLSMPSDAERSSNYINEMVNYRKFTLNVNTSYAAIYAPGPKVYDKFNDQYIYISAEGFVGAIISETAANYEMWYPPAGFRRGILNVLDVRRRFTSGEMDYLYDNGINPIRFAPGRGILVWGQKTLLARPSALDRLNVRLLLIVIEPACKVALEDFVFELNDAATRAQVVVMLDTYMQNIKARRGVYDYKIICDESNNTPDDIDNYILNVWLFVKPTKAIEYIPFTVVITSTGMDFNLASQLI